MQSRFIQMQSRLASLKTENDEVCTNKEFALRAKTKNEHLLF